MMKNGQSFIPVVVTILLIFCFFADHQLIAQTEQQQMVRKMNITGQIAKAEHGYIIRGKKPFEIFSILNPAADILDEYVKSSKIVSLEVRIVSGDNIEIEKIDGEEISADKFKQNLKTQNEKESYSIGYQVGLSMKSDGVEVSFEKLAQGLRDAIDEKNPSLNAEEMKKLIVDLKKRAHDVQMRKIQELVVKNARESEKFLEENKKKDGIKTTASGLQYMVLKEGDGTSPGLTDFVTVNYRGTFTDGKEFDSSYAKGEPAKFQADGVIKGWIEVLPMMKAGSKWRIFVPPALAYGRGGLGNRIPPNKVLVFEIELLDVEKGNQVKDK